MSGHLDSVVALHRAQSELRSIETSLAGIPDWMSELHDEHSARRAEIDEVVEEREEAGRKRRQAEADLEDAQEQLKHFQGQISRVSTQREYGALLKEIDTVKNRIADEERKAIEAMETSEEADGKLATMREDFQELDGRYDTELEKWEGEKPGLAERAETLRKEAAEVREQIPRPILALYDRLFQRFGADALSRVQRVEGARGANAMWACVACSYSVRPQIVVDIRNEGNLHQCDACKRILYWGG